MTLRNLPYLRNSRPTFSESSAAIFLYIMLFLFIIGIVIKIESRPIAIFLYIILILCIIGIITKSVIIDKKISEQNNQLKILDKYPDIKKIMDNLHDKINNLNLSDRNKKLFMNDIHTYFTDNYSYIGDESKTSTIINEIDLIINKYANI